MRARKSHWLVALVALAAVGAVYLGPQFVGRVAYAVQSGQAVAARESLAQAQNLSAAFHDVATAVKPSVVHIESIRKQQVRMRQMPFDDEFFERFFGGRPRGMPRETPRGQEFVQRGQGTGVIVSKDGFVLTNSHVVAEADKVVVTLSNEERLDAEVVGVDEQTDLAVIRIDAQDLLPAELGDSDAVKVGDWVLALGNPFGLSHTVTAGIISASGRANMGIANYEDFIQTDAAINPGNSGGPLVNLAGEVIGINTAIATRTGGYMGIGFAIPSNMAKRIMDIIIREGKVARGWLGVVIQNLNEDLAQSFGFDSTDGVLVGDVSEGGPADKAGIQSGDIITHLNGKVVDNMNDLRNQVALTSPGTEVDIKVFREGQRKTLEVTIGELENATASLSQAGPEITAGIGMTVEPLTPRIAQQLGLSRDVEGVVVTEVEAGSVAEKAGIVRGDVILAVGRERVRSVDDFRAAMRDADLDSGVRLRLNSRGMQRFVFLKK